MRRKIRSLFHFENPWELIRAAVCGIYSVWKSPEIHHMNFRAITNFLFVLCIPNFQRKIFQFLHQNWPKSLFYFCDKIQISDLARNVVNWDFFSPFSNNVDEDDKENLVMIVPPYLPMRSQFGLSLLQSSIILFALLWPYDQKRLRFTLFHYVYSITVIRFLQFLARNLNLDFLFCNFVVPMI